MHAGILIYGGLSLCRILVKPGTDVSRKTTVSRSSRWVANGTVPKEKGVSERLATVALILKRRCFERQQFAEICCSWGFPRVQLLGGVKRLGIF